MSEDLALQYWLADGWLAEDFESKGLIYRLGVKYKTELASLVENALAEFAKGDYKTKNNTEQMRKCSQCGKSFHGRADQGTCSSKCRMAKSRS